MHFLYEALTLNAPGARQMVFVFHLVVPAEILSVISQNNNIGFVFRAEVVSNPFLFQNWLQLFGYFS